MAEHQNRLKFVGLERPSFRWKFTTAVLCVFTVAVVGGTPSYWYDPPCLKHDFTWTTQSGKTQECHYMEREFEYSCNNPLAPLRNESMRPPPVAILRSSYYTTQFISDGSVPSLRDWEGIWSGLNITFQIGPEAAGKITGILFSMESLTKISDDYGLLVCRAFDFRGPLDADALLGEDGNPLKLFFDCFRGQKPGMEYEYSIRTLPVVDLNDVDTAVKVQYRTPSCYSIPNDFLCISKTNGPLQEIELCAHWRPQYFVVMNDKLNLFVAMELGPEECGFNRFRFAVPTVRELNNDAHIWDDATDIDIANMCQFETLDYGRNITYIKVKLTAGSGQRVVMAVPSPTHNTCFNKEGQAWPCSVTYSAILMINANNHCPDGQCSDAVHVGNEATCVCQPGYMREGGDRCIKDPCAPMNGATQIPHNPCGLGSCIINNDKKSYSCNCNYGYTSVDGTCKVDPCVPNPCGNGTCHPISSPQSEMDYSCQCQSGYMEHSKMCKVDPCYHRSDVESNPCGHHGECQHALRSYYATDEASVTVPYICVCDSGYDYIVSQQTCRASTSLLVNVAVIIVSVLIAALLIMVLVVVKRRKVPGSFVYQALQSCKKGDEGIMHGTPNNSPSSSVDGIIMSATNNEQERIEIIRPLKRVKVVLLCTNDHPIHGDAVQKFATFLKAECMCDVEMPMSCEKNIALKGESEWISYILRWADKVILLCSKGTRIKWRAHCNSAQPPDMFIRAVSVILKDITSVSLSDKYCISYFDYSSRNDVPEPLSVGAVFCLMKHMDALFFRLHNMTPGSPRSQKCAPNLEEGNYATVSMEGEALRSAIKCMHDFQREEVDWFERFNSEDMLPTRNVQFSLFPSPLVDTVSQVDEADFDQSLMEFETMESSHV